MNELESRDCPAPDIDVCDVQTHVLVDPDDVRAWCHHVMRVEGVSVRSLSVALVDDSAIHRVNRDYLAHDWPTDVVTFTLSDDTEPLSGEIVVSCETAARVGGALGHDGRAEVALYVVHGVLHLCGFDDQTPEGARRMSERQAAHLEALGLGRLQDPDSRVRGGEPCPT